MQRLQLEQFNLLKTSADCIAQKADPELRGRLNTSVPTVISAAAQYQRRGAAETLYGFQPDPMPPGGATPTTLLTFTRRRLLAWEGGDAKYTTGLCSLRRGELVRIVVS
jgi:hypothetical protein